ncbi:MAG: SusC/RagA family TonB-linked outer membrane protein [Bacteroidales bacterium]|jgi:TonB-linked SusC/RagA family outer membrane protein|nr:SusC/RagA family TonB-linked outer membrane protein [Bacteroidales bacterium]
MKKISTIIGILCLGISTVLAQTVSITGTVVSAEDGETLPGVSVLVKGTTRGTTTSINGTYSIQATEDAVLVFSFVGMNSQEVPVGINRVINVSMEMASTSIDEVVVTALGMTSERKALGYAAQDIKNEALTQASNTNLMTSLQGKVSGVDIKPSSGMPGASSQVVIRGARSFTGNNNPLYVIDGMPVSSGSDFQSGFGAALGYAGDGVTGTDISNRAIDIDPNEIESINILKGQAASALYGIRASNGVVIITTKSGRGLAKGKPVVSVNVSASMDRISRKPDFQNTWAQGSYGLFTPNTSVSWGPRVEDLPDDPGYGGNTVNEYTAAAQDAGINTTGKYYVPQLAQAGLDPWATPQKYDNIDDFFKLGFTTSISANVSQALDKGNYSFGIGNTHQEGIISTSGMDRTSLKAAAETDLWKGFKTGFTANYIHNNIDKLPTANDGLLGTVYPAPINYNLKGIPYSSPTDPYEQTNYRSLTFNNPYWSLDHNQFDEKTDRFFGNAFLEYSPLINWSSDKKLKFRFQSGADTYTTHFQDIWEYGSRGGTGSINNYGVTSATFNSLLTANYEMKFTPDLHFTAMLGGEFNHENIKMYSERGTGFTFGGWKHINNTAIQVADEYQEEARTVGFFGSLTLSYRNMVYLSATGRNDIVSSMPRNNRSFFYPSVSLSFIASELNIMKAQDIVSFLKLRASYAEVGQAGSYMKNYYTTPNYSGSWWDNLPIQYPIDGTTSFIPANTLYDPNLKPQNTRSYEVGIDIRFLDNLFGIDYTYSRQNVTDQIFDIPRAGSTGIYYMAMNGGKIHTNAHEVILNINPIRTTDIDWNIGINFSKIDNYVDKLADGVNSIFLGGFETPQVRAGIGDKFPVIWGTSFDRDEQGRILVDEDPTSWSYGMPMAGSNEVIGKVSPDFILGANTTFRYKRISAGATLEWKHGGQMYSGTNGLGYTYGTAKVTEDRSTPFIYKGYKEDGTLNDIQRGGEGDPDAYEDLYSNVLGNIDEAFIFDASFVKLREVVIGYEIPRIGIFDMKVSLFARNLLLWTKLPAIDPESSQGNTNMGGAFERFSMPQTSSFGISLNVVF